MRIISDFHDYYDGVAAQGIDKSRVFLRKQDDRLDLAERKYESAFIEGIEYAYPTNNNTLLTPFVVFVAGKTYPGIKINAGFPNGTISFCYSKEEFEAHKNDVGLDRYFRKDRWSHFAIRRLGEHIGSKYNYKGFFDYWTKQDSPLVKELVGDMIEMKETVSIMSGFRFFIPGSNNRIGNKPGMFQVYCPRLKDIEFQRVVDPYTLFQDLDMYVGGVLPEVKSVDEIADKYKIQQHGFDPIWSFRKHKLDNQEK